MSTLTGAEKKYLRGLAHGLKPVVRIGKNGLTETVIASLEEALASHELIKVKFADHTDRKREISADVAARLDAGEVGAIGHMAIFFRPAREPEKRSIRLPAPARPAPVRT